MGKAKKLKVSKGATKVPLEDQIADGQFVKPKSRVKTRGERKETDGEYVSSNLSKKILVAAHKQQRELEDEFGPTPSEAYPKRPKTTKLGPSTIQESDTESEMEDTLEPDTFYENLEVDEDMEKQLETFMSDNPKPRRALADIIMDKLTEHQTVQSEISDVGSFRLQDLDPKTIEYYEAVRDVLRRYRSGKLPKAFKTVPMLANWEQILHVTDPPSWSAAAMYQATRIFASNLTEKMAQKFYNLVLLPRVRDDLAEYKRLNFHLYQALRKALFKPGAFMKGLLLPLLESGDCTLREAIIIGSVVARNSIPALHSAVCMLSIAEMDYTGANSIFLRIFFDKKYALPYRCVDAIVTHFLRFALDSRELPVLWHQAFLTFVQRYKGDITSEQRDLLLDLLERQNHPTVASEIRRELRNAQCRAEMEMEVSQKDNQLKIIGNQ